MHKRFFAWIFVAVLLFVPLTYTTARATATSGVTGDCTWTLVGTVLTVSGDGAMADYTAQQPAPWGTALTAVHIEDGVTAIGDYAFANGYSLTAVTIPGSVMTVGNGAFSNCVDLATVTVENGVKHIGGEAFSGCADLHSLHLPSSVTTLGERAFAVAGLRSIKLSDSLVTIGDYAFYYCSSLTEITVPDSVTTIGAAAFYRCGKLASVTIGAGVSDIGSLAFCGCEGLTAITIPGGVTTLGSGVFSSCAETLTVTCSTHYVAEYAADSGIQYRLNIPAALTYSGAQVCVDGDHAIRFGFTVGCDGVSRNEQYTTVINGNAILNIDGTPYPLVGFGANVATRYSAAATLTGVDVPAGKLYSVNGDDTVTYTARVTGLTANGQDHRDTVIFVNGYVKYRDGDEMKTLTTGVVAGRYNTIKDN